MDSRCQTTALPATSATAAQPTAICGPFAALQRLLNTACFVSVDLTDTLFASLPKPEGAPQEAARPSKPD